MNGPQFTDGPWFVANEVDGQLGRTRIKALHPTMGEVTVARTQSMNGRPHAHHSEWEGNAEIMAAAPRFLDALLKIVQDAPEHEEQSWYEGRVDPLDAAKAKHYRLAQIARAALREGGFEP